MSELKPCKCRCGAELERRSGVAGSDHVMAWKHPIRSDCPLAVTPILDHEVPTWNLFMDDTPDLLRGARIGLEMAAKYHDVQSAEWREYARRAELEYDEEDGEDDDAALRASACREHAGQHLNDALKLRAITDADIMKEISRE